MASNFICILIFFHESSIIEMFRTEKLRRQEILLNINHLETPRSWIRCSCITKLIWNCKHLFSWLSEPWNFLYFIRMMSNVNSFNNLFLWMINEVILILINWNDSFTWSNYLSHFLREVFWRCLLLFKRLQQVLMRNLLLKLQRWNMIIHHSSLKRSKIKIFTWTSKWCKFNLRSFNRWNIRPVWI